MTTNMKLLSTFSLLTLAAIFTASFTDTVAAKPQMDQTANASANGTSPTASRS